MKNLITTAKELGAGNAILYWIDQVGVKFLASRMRVFKYNFVSQPITDKPFIPARRGANISIQKFTGATAAVRSLPVTPEVLAFRLDQGSHVLIATLNDQYAGHLWYTLGSYREDEVRCTYRLEPPDATAWDYDASIADEFRLSLVFARLWDAARQEMFKAGVRASASRISAFNSDSLRSHQRLGARGCGFAVFLVIGRVQLTVSTLSPFLHLSMSARSAPTITIRTQD